MKSIGSVIKFIRTQRDMTQVELSELVGTSTSYISLMERDKKNMTVTMMIAVFEAFKFSPVLAFYLIDTQSVEQSLSERLAYAVFKELDKDIDTFFDEEE